jgi:serine/threonine protein kinase
LAIQIDLPLFVGAQEPAASVALNCTSMPLEEQMGEGVLGVTWRSRLADGTAVAVKRLTARGRDVRGRLEQLQRAGNLGNPHLLDLLSVFEEADGHLWVAFRLDDGVPLSRLLEWDRMRPACGVAVAMAVLSALASLHNVGVWHGAVHARNVHIAGDGTVRLGDYGLAREPAGEPHASLRASDVLATGAMLAATLGHTRLRESSLGLAVRAITGSRRLMPAGHEAAHASLTLWEGARRLATTRRQAQAREQLAAMVAEIRHTIPPPRPFPASSGGI